MQAIPERRKISPFLVFYLIHSVQVGVGVLGFQRVIAVNAGYDSWISIILAGGLTHILMFMMYRIVQMSDGDLVSAHTFAFGKWIGKIFSFIFVLYFAALVVTIIRTYIEVVQVWMFPRMNTFLFSLFFLLLVIYIVKGGIRTIAGVSFFGLILPSYLLLTFGFTFQYADFRNILPIFDHSIMDILKSMKSMSLTYLGYESILLIYPFIKEGKASQKWAQWGLFASTLVYTLIGIISFAFFSEGQLKKTVWATLSMWKILELPFVERFEYIGIANWCLIILPNACIAIWCASRIVKRATPLKQSTSLIWLSLVCLSVLTLFPNREKIDMLNNILSQTGFYINFVYIPFLFVLILVIKRVKKKL
ncbi:GerAB/ArcD/ProY family transporter [Bacillus seohaeanensis]|jgi:spore germination protein AB|uniref:GerAB/ArcD/ProY family transporter n=1 Tax=Bacillus seohaeanensis TaxID=284580 RepID=A0ABW5RP11_9BACI